MKKIWDKENLEKHWALNDEDRKFLSYKENTGRIICAFKLKYLLLYNNFPESLGSFPFKILKYLSTQLRLDPKLPGKVGALEIITLKLKIIWDIKSIMEKKGRNLCTGLRIIKYH